jgi:hypothetical protein
MRPLARIVPAVCVLLALALAGAQGSGAAPGGYEVGLGHERAKIGGFTQDGVGDPKDMQAVFGPADKRKGDDFLCTLRWTRIGLRADFAAFGPGDPCTKGTFVEADLTQRRWVTTNGIRRGTPERRVREVAKRECTRNTCGVRGYALELHLSECAAEKVPGVIAVVRDGRVRKLVVRWRGCE